MIRTGMFPIEGTDAQARWDQLIAWADAMALEQRDIQAQAGQVGPFLPGFIARESRFAAQGYEPTRLRLRLPNDAWYAVDHHALVQIAGMLGVSTDIIQRGLERGSKTLTHWLREEWNVMGQTPHRWRTDGALVRAVLSDAYGPLDSVTVLRELRLGMSTLGLEPIRVVHTPHRHRLEFARQRSARNPKGLRAGLVMTNSEVADAALTLAPAVVGGRFTSRLDHPVTLELRHTMHAATRLLDRAPTALPALMDVADDALTRWMTQRNAPVGSPDHARWQRALEPALGKPLATKVLAQWGASIPGERTWQTLFHAVAEAARSLNDPSASLDVERLLTIVLYPDVAPDVARDAGTSARAAEGSERRTRRSAATAAVA